MKRCSKCGEEKELTEFHRAKKGKFGRTAECKSCVSEAARIRYKKLKCDEVGYKKRLEREKHSRRLKSDYYERTKLRFDARSKGNKICSRCGFEKPQSDFFRNHAATDGFNSRCKICNLESVREWSENNKEKVRIRKQKEYIKARQCPERRERMNRISLVARKSRYENDPVFAARCRAKTILSAMLDLPIREIPSDLIEAKAAQLMVKRFAERGK